jgi:predicted regulator of Ras-like GTPase activity (Roadblock/LC7/MglB family)/tetratricopeptide (TPR) repeat protein
MAGNITEDIKRLSDTLARDPDSIVFASLAELYLKQGMIDEAIKMSMSGLKKHPNYLKGHRVLAEAYMTNGMVHSAKGEYEKILELNPDDQEAKDKLASSFWEKQKPGIAPHRPETSLEDKAVAASFGEGKAEEPLATPLEEEIESEVIPPSEEIPTEEEPIPSLEQTLEEVELELEAENAFRKPVEPVEEEPVPQAAYEEPALSTAELRPEEALGPEVEEADQFLVESEFDDDFDFPFKSEAPEEPSPAPAEVQTVEESFVPTPGAREEIDSPEPEPEPPLGSPLEDEEIEEALSAGLLLEKHFGKQRVTQDEKAAAVSGLDALIRSFETIRKEHGAPPPPKPTAVSPEPTASGLSALDQILNDLLQKSGVKAALLIDSSGLVVESASDLQIDVEETAALISGVFDSSQKTMETLNLGKVDRIAIEIGGKRVYMTKAGDYTLMVETDNTMRLGLLMVLAKKTAHNIQELMT